MKKLIILFLSILVLNSYGQNDKKLPSSKKAQTYVDGAKASIEKLDSKIAIANWADKSFKAGFNSELENLDSKIKSIKRDDPDYKIEVIEDRYNFYVSQKEEGLNKLKDGKAADKAKKEDEAKKKEEEKIKALMAKDEGVTNSTHEKNLQKIIFSSTEISRDNPNESQFGKEFKITSPVYFRIYLKNSIYNEVQRTEASSIFETHLGIACKIYLDGVIAYEGPMPVKNDGIVFLKEGDRKTLTSISGAFNFNGDKLGSLAYIRALVSQESKLTTGNHNLKFELFPSYKSIKPATNQPMATGEFVLVVTGGFVNPANNVVCMPKAVKKDATLETKYKECVKKYLVNNEKDAVMKSFVLLSSDWEIRKDDITGKPISKTVYGAAGLSYKNGKCTYETFSFTQNWNGSSYSTTIETSSTNQDGDIFCDCLK